MSTFYLSVNMISRGKGQSAVASASYRSGEPLKSDMDMEIKSYKTRNVLPDTFIEAPDHAPEWIYNRERLWNEVEHNENKINSQLAREVRVALPIELDHDTQRNLLQEYVKDNFVKRGMVADVSIHRDVEHNPHAHIMLTVRPFNENGEWGAKQKREYRKDENNNYILKEDGKKKPFKVELTDWDKRETLAEWRKNFAEKVNEYYKNNDIKEEVSHESYENQGLEKIPKHRLSVSEYAIEKREKQNAEKEEIVYTPKTHFAQLNDEIDKTNQEVELLNQKVVDLQEYRKTVQAKTNEEIKSLRYKFSLSDDDWRSLKVVAKRTQGFVDIPHAKDNLKRLDFWKSKLTNEKLDIVSMGKTLEKAKLVYKDNPKDVMMYGFIPSKFEGQYKDKVKLYEGDIEGYNEKINAYNEMHKHSKRAYAIQKSFANEEFRYLYPNYADKLDNNDKSMELKSSYIEKFKTEGGIRDSIPELDTNIGKYSDSYVHAKELIKDWKDNSNSLVILERTKTKTQREYGEQYKDWDSDKVFNKSVKFTNTKEQIQSKESHKINLDNKISNHLKVIYPSLKDETLAKLPSQSKARVLELYVDGRSTGKFSKDISTIDKEIKADLQKEGKEIHNHNSSSTSGAGDLFSGIVNNAQQNENKDDDLERKRQKAKKKKIRKHREIGENEL